MPRLPRSTLRVWLTVSLCLTSTLLSCDAHFLSMLFDWRTVCQPDFKICPNNGLAFRDHRHDCQYPPCEFVPPGPPPPPPTERDELEVSKWFGNREFVVPVLNVSMIRKGQRVQQKWLEAQRAKQMQVLNGSQASTVRGFIDLYVVPRAPTDPFLAAQSRVLRRHVTSLVTSTGVTTDPSTTTQPTTTSPLSPSSSGSQASGSEPGDVGDDEPDTPSVEPSNVVSHPPWSHLELYGQIASGVATTEAVQTVLELLRLRLKNETLVNKTEVVIQSPTRPFVTMVVEVPVESELEQEASVMAELLTQCENLTQALTPYVPALNMSVRVFTTDFRRHDGDHDYQDSWNVTRVECSESAGNATEATPFSSSDSSDSGAANTGTSPVVVLKRLPASDSQVESSSQVSTCSCWKRSSKAAGVDAGDLEDEDEPSQSLTWMLCS